MSGLACHLLSPQCSSGLVLVSQPCNLDLVFFRLVILITLVAASHLIMHLTELSRNTQKCLNPKLCGIYQQDCGLDIL